VPHIHSPLHYVKVNAVSVVAVRHHTDVCQHTNRDTAPDKYQSKCPLSVHTCTVHFIQNT